MTSVGGRRCSWCRKGDIVTLVLNAVFSCRSCGCPLAAAPASSSSVEMALRTQGCFRPSPITDYLFKRSRALRRETGKVVPRDGSSRSTVKWLCLFYVFFTILRNYFSSDNPVGWWSPRWTRQREHSRWGSVSTPAGCWHHLSAPHPRADPSPQANHARDASAGPHGEVTGWPKRGAGPRAASLSVDDKQFIRSFILCQDILQTFPEQPPHAKYRGFNRGHGQR